MTRKVMKGMTPRRKVTENEELCITPVVEKQKDFRSLQSCPWIRLREESFNKRPGEEKKVDG